MAVLPPLHLLVPFEAAARRQSFKDAARELHVTPSAVSQQIKQLEETLSLALFDRRARGVELTEAGHFYFAIAKDCLERFRSGTEALLRRHGPRPVRLNTVPELALDVLIPALAEFERDHPDVDLRIETSSALLDLRLRETDAVDATVRYGTGPWVGHASKIVAEMTAAVVASPDLLRRTPIHDAQDLGKHTLLYVQGASDYWTYFAEASGFEIRKRKAFDSYLAALQAAVHGAGVAMGLFPLSTAWVADGRLCTPLEDRYPAAPYHFVTREDDADRPDLALVRKWVVRCFERLPTGDARLKMRQ